MPELPEVENLRRGLEKTITGQKIIEVKVNKPKLVSGKGTVRIASKKRQGEFILGLRGERFIKIERRAKNLIFRLSHNKTILAHLKMSGQFVYRPGQLRSRVFSSEKAVDTRVERKKTRPGLQLIIGGHPIELSERELPNKHTHVIFELERGTLFYNDTRMFGYLLYYSTIELFEGGNHF
ncbi:hypothetical protein HYZ82_01040, partial [Candidatus Nomurabacteria bacterium]|nr:hypothetical protein [Candidatus Nomurabacteria bacterium]